MKSGSIRFLAIIGIGLAAVATAKLTPPASPTPLQGVARVRLDLARPDALIDSRRLSALPAAVLRAPVLKQLLSEEFAFYHEELDTRLDVNGAVKRIAYEHDLTLSDRLLDSVFDEPAELAFWRQDGGRPGYWLLNLHRNGLEKLLEFLVNAKLNDSQLRHVGTLSLAGGASTPLYALKLNRLDTLLLASHQDRLVVASHPGMLLAENGRLQLEPARVVAAMLQAPDASPQARHFAAGDATPPRQAEHRISVGADLPSFGYGRFLPGLEAVRFEHREGAWSTALRIGQAGGAEFANPPWRAMPFDAAFCAGLPVAKEELAELAVDKAVLAGLKGEVAACWYEDGLWQAPLFAARFDSPEAARQAAPALARLFGDWIGAREFAHREGRFPVRTTTGRHGETLWRREVSARYGDMATPAGRAGEFSGDAYFDVSLALAGDTVLFSPSAQRLDKALDTLARQFPAMAERLPVGRPVLFALDGARLAGFLRLATLEALPEDKEPALRRIADGHLLPRYAALGAEHAFAATLPASLPAGRPAWVAVDWQILK